LSSAVGGSPISTVWNSSEATTAHPLSEKMQHSELLNSVVIKLKNW